MAGSKKKLEAVEELSLMQDSVEVSRNAKGVYSWKTKLYFDREKKKGKEAVIKDMKEMDSMLDKIYG